MPFVDGTKRLFNGDYWPRAAARRARTSFASSTASATVSGGRAVGPGDLGLGESGFRLRPADDIGHKRWSIRAKASGDFLDLVHVAKINRGDFELTYAAFERDRRVSGLGRAAVDFGAAVASDKRKCRRQCNH
ncbi:hypothetical protein [Brevundimonas naejangsanensis]|uniref:hypothetical protein n=1 Tax=Brevundimonas naejangsanensis TaxID=588932 RepID=UPI00119CF946|nr:hypothetical protein [Brevundimonas naejangsanensis]